MGAGGSVGVTQPLGAAGGSKTAALNGGGGAGIGSTVPLEQNRGFNNVPQGADDRQKTVALMKKAMGIDPVVGWLVCIEGADKGKDYRIRAQRNFIGRGETMDICIRGDETISRENHTIISYNEKNNGFKIAPGDSKGITYLNDEEVLMAMNITSYDVIEIGKTKLVFIPLCGERFKWEQKGTI
jgi:hypothetical protein